MTTNDIRARSGMHHERITVAGVDYMTQWPSRGARDRFALAVASTEHYTGSRWQVFNGTLYPRPIHVTTRQHWS